MMEPVLRIDKTNAQSTQGCIVFDGKKAVWNLGMLVSALILGPLFFSLHAFLLFIFLTYFSLLIGHSVGMHRLMIHRTFETPLWVSRSLIYVGVLVGMSGPCGIIRIHDTRDWAQRQLYCHDFFSHKRGFFQDVWWQLTSTFQFDSPPKVIIENKYSNDPVIQFFENTWRWHQVFVALILYLLGGWSFVVWGVFVRVAVSIVGHWSITYFCHNPGPGKWKVKGAAVQASNIPGLGLLTYGECWHNNHHAFPESAKIGLEKGQVDPSWWFIKLLEKMNLAYNVKLPRVEGEREDLDPIDSEPAIRN